MDIANHRNKSRRLNTLMLPGILIIFCGFKGLKITFNYLLIGTSGPLIQKVGEYQTD